MSDSEKIGEASGTSDGACRRNNTLEEKRKMRNERKKRLRKKKRVAMKEQVHRERGRRECAERKVVLYRRMSRSYWERWRWELTQRKEAMVRERAAALRLGKPSYGTSTALQEIDPAQLSNPDGSCIELFIGRGCFGLVKVQYFRGIKVAVKEMLPRTALADVQHEARILVKLCHPYLPYLFGVCTAAKPYKIIMQFHGLVNSSLSITLMDVISTRKIMGEYVWLTLCAQIMEALRYIHEEVGILHNDLKANNIIMSQAVTEHASENEVQIVVIDFGKATTIENGRKYHLSESEEAEYIQRFPHISPEVVYGVTRQSWMSDMFAAGGVLQRILDRGFLSQLTQEDREVMRDLITKCRLPKYTQRIRAQKALAVLEDLMTNDM